MALHLLLYYNSQDIFSLAIWQKLLEMESLKPVVDLADLKADGISKISQEWKICTFILYQERLNVRLLSSHYQYLIILQAIS